MNPESVALDQSFLTGFNLHRRNQLQRTTAADHEVENDQEKNAGGSCSHDGGDNQEKAEDGGESTPRPNHPRRAALAGAHFTQHPRPGSTTKPAKHPTKAVRDYLGSQMGRDAAVLLSLGA